LLKKNSKRSLKIVFQLFLSKTDVEIILVRDLDGRQGIQARNPVAQGRSRIAGRLFQSKHGDSIMKTLSFKEILAVSGGASDTEQGEDLAARPVLPGFAGAVGNAVGLSATRPVESSPEAASVSA
jgi:hypothetical protein